MTTQTASLSRSRLQALWLSRLHRLIESPLGAVLGGAVYGGWATFANWMYGMTMALRVGMVHFAITTGLTFVGVRVIHTLFRLSDHPVLGALIATAGSLSVTYGLLLGVHFWLGTPEILLTLLPGILPTLGFTLGYSWLLMRRARQQAAHTPSKNLERGGFEGLAMPWSSLAASPSLRFLVDYNLALLDQARELASHYARLGDEAYAGKVGPHLRHIIDHYLEFLHGSTSGVVDYEKRSRNPALEQRPECAVQALDQIRSAIAELADKGHRRLAVVVANGLDGSQLSVSRSSLARELQFLALHTVHHFALIQPTLIAEGLPLPANFGKAPGTIRHERPSEAPGESGV